MSKKTKNLVTFATSLAMVTNIITGGVPTIANAETLQVSADNEVESAGSVYVNHSATYTGIMNLVSKANNIVNTISSTRYVSVNGIDCNAKYLGVFNGNKYIQIDSFNVVPKQLPSEVVCLGADGVTSATYKIASISTKACNQVTDASVSHQLVIPEGVCAVTGSTGISEKTSGLIIPSSMEAIPINFVSGKSNIKTVEFKGNTCAVEYGAFSGTGITRIEIPSGFKLGDAVFEGCTSLNNVTLPSEMTTIPNGTFRGCTSLTGIVIPQKVTSIGDTAFSESGINYTIMNGVHSSDIIDISNISSIGAGAFSGCKNLNTVKCSKSLTSMGNSAFRNSSLKTISIPEDASISSFGESSFGYTNLSNFKVPNNVFSLNSRSFVGCKELTTVTFHNKFTTLKESVFNGCSKLSKLDLPSTLTSMCDDVFNNAGTEPAIAGGDAGIDLTLRTLPTYTDADGKSHYAHFKGIKTLTVVNAEDGTGVTELPNGIFANNDTLKSVTLNEGLTSVGAEEFMNCTKLQSVKLPSTVKSLGDDSFNGATELTSVVQTPAKKSDNTEFYRLTTIGSGAFKGCNKMTSFNITDGVTSVGNEAFLGCDLQTLNVPLTVKSIGYSSFKDNVNLGEVTLNKGLESIGATAFQNDAKLSLVVKSEGVVVSGVYVPSTIKYIGKDAFDGANLPVYFSSNTEYTVLPKLDENGQEVEYAKDEKKNIQVLQYYGTDASVDFTTLSDSYVIKTIVDGAFKNNTQLVTATIPSTATTLGKNLFEGCTSLKNAVIPATVKEIPENCFMGCTSLVNVSFNTEKKSLEDIKKESVDEYNKYVQLDEKGNPKYSEITVGTRVINTGAFSNCSKLEYITLPSTLEEVKTGAFDSCAILHSLTFSTIPEDIQRPEPKEGQTDNKLYLTIDENAFSNCNILGYWTSAVDSNSVRYPLSIPDDVKIHKDAFTRDTILQNKGFQYQLTDDGVDIVKCYGYNYTSVEGKPNATQSEMTKTIEVPSVLNGRNVGYIGKDAFNNGSSNSITEAIKLNEGIKGIKGHAFYNCGKLQSIQLCNSLESIEDYAFGGTNLKTVEIPTKVTGVSSRAFKDSAIQSVKSGNYTYKMLFTGAVNDEFQGIEILSHAGGQDASVTIPSKLNGFKVKGIGTGSFINDDSLTSLSLADGIEYVSEGAVKDCKNFSTFNNTGTCSVNGNAFIGTAISTHYDNGIEYKIVGDSVIITKYTGNASILSIPKSYENKTVTTIADNAFSSCTNLVSVTLEEGVTSIGTNAFSGCSLLSSVVIPYTVTSVGAGAFASCTQLQTIVLPNLGVLSDNLFKGCTKLQTVTLPSVSTIGADAFNGCAKLSVVVIPESVKVIGKGAFIGTSLETVTIPHDQGIVVLDGAFNEGTKIAYKTAGQECTVVFKNWNGTVLKSEVVTVGGTATAPESPTRDGYTFAGWGKDLSNINTSMEVVAQFSPTTGDVSSALPLVGSMLSAIAGVVGFKRKRK